MYVEERVSTGRILLMSARSAKALSPMRLHGSLWRKSVTLQGLTYRGFLTVLVLYYKC